MTSLHCNNLQLQFSLHIRVKFSFSVLFSINSLLYKIVMSCCAKIPIYSCHLFFSKWCAGPKLHTMLQSTLNNFVHYFKNDNLDKKAKEAYKSILFLAYYTPPASQFYEFASEVKNRSKTLFNYQYGSDEEVRNRIVCLFCFCCFLVKYCKWKEIYTRNILFVVWLKQLKQCAGYEWSISV